MSSWAFNLAALAKIFIRCFFVIVSVYMPGRSKRPRLVRSFTNGTKSLSLVLVVPSKLCKFWIDGRTLESCVSFLVSLCKRSDEPSWLIGPNLSRLSVKFLMFFSWIVSQGVTDFNRKLLFVFITANINIKTIWALTLRCNSRRLKA